VSPPDGTSPTKPLLRKGDGLLHPQNAPQGTFELKSVLVVILFLDGENFLTHEEDVFIPVLGVPLEEMFCSCPSDFLHSRSKEVFI
jgi:hypothetical protein